MAMPIQRADRTQYQESREVELVSTPEGNSSIGETSPELASSRITVPEIARRLNIGRLAVYAMLDQGILPGIRLGRRWIVTRHGYQQWERTCGMNQPEQKAASGSDFTSPQDRGKSMVLCQ
jgi:excisionase family DNA binding protein